MTNRNFGASTLVSLHSIFWEDRSPVPRDRRPWFLIYKRLRMHDGLGVSREHTEPRRLCQWLIISDDFTLTAATCFRLRLLSFSYFLFALWAATTRCLFPQIVLAKLLFSVYTECYTETPFRIWGDARNAVHRRQSFFYGFYSIVANHVVINKIVLQRSFPEVSRRDISDISYFTLLFIG